MKPHLNVGVLGQPGHGKTALTAALDKVMAARHGGSFASIEQLERPAERTRGLDLAVAHVEYESADRHYAHVDLPAASHYAKALISGAVQLDAAILVVAAPPGPLPQSLEHVRLARVAGVPAIVVYLNELEPIDDAELLDLIELEARSLVSSFGYPGAETPVVRGSARKALEGSEEALGVPSIVRLVEAMDRFLPVPERPVDRPFRMPVEDVFSVDGGTVATGRVARGRVREGDEVAIVGLAEPGTAIVSVVEMFRKRLDQARVGDNVGVTLDGVDRDDVERGHVLAAPGSIAAHARLEAELYLLTPEEGGRSTPITAGYRPQLYFHTIDVTGTVTLPEGVERALPGGVVSSTVELAAPVAMERGTRFAVREGGRTVAAGIVTRILE